MSPGVWEFLHCEVFASVLSSGTSFFFFWSHPLCSFMLMPLPSLSSSCCIVVTPLAAGPCAHDLLFLLWLHACTVTTLHFFAALSSLLASSHLITNFGKISRGFFTGRDGSNTTATQLHVWPEWWVLSDTSRTDFERSDVIGHWWRMHIYLHSDW